VEAGRSCQLCFEDLLRPAVMPTNTLFAPEDYPFGTTPLRATARSVLDTLARAVRAFPAFEAGDCDPVALTASSVRDLKPDQLESLRQFMKDSGLCTLSISVRPGKPQDSIRLLPDGANFPALRACWLAGNVDGLVRWLAPLLKTEQNVPLTDQGRVLAAMLGRRVDHTLGGGSTPGNGNPTLENVARVLRARAQGEHLPAKKRTGEIPAREAYLVLAQELGVSPMRAGAVLAHMLRAGRLPGLVGVEGSPAANTAYAVQKVIATLEDGSWSAGRYVLDYLGKYTSVRLEATPST